MNPNQLTRRRQSSITRTATQPPLQTQNTYMLAVVVGSESLDAAKWQWIYEIAQAEIDPTTMAVTRKSATSPTYDAYSISELGNTTTIVANGVQISHLPATIVPVKIPNGTPVWCVPQRATDGSFFYLILNTQAITGPCA